MVMSVFMLSYALGPFVLSPCSEIWGRVNVIRFGNMIFIFFLAMCGWAQSKEQIIAFRFLAGLGGSATMGVSLQSCRLGFSALTGIDGQRHNRRLLAL
jgi:MFS family permease